MLQSRKGEVGIRVIKRSGQEVLYDRTKIYKAIKKADSATANESIPIETINQIIDEIEAECKEFSRSIRIEEIQDQVIDKLFSYGFNKIGRNYLTYRYERALRRKENSIDSTVLSLLDYKNELLIEENSNKNPTIVSVMRDYMAGEVSKDIARRYIYSSDVIEAHDEGIIHIHDMDYIAMPEHNCCLCNLEDVLNYGTVINNTAIDPPKSFLTACTVASQVAAAISSSQFGGQTMSAKDLAPFVDISRQKYRKRVREELLEAGIEPSEEQVNSIAEKRTQREVKDGIQTFMYQINSIMGSNGQTPFITFYMDINEVPEGQTRDDLVLIIKETLEQRIEGMKNQYGVKITQSFPKLIYSTAPNNIEEDSEYYWLTELAAKCTAKRMVPDYISSDVMLERKGDVYPCMGLSMAHVKPCEPC